MRVRPTPLLALSIALAPAPLPAGLCAQVALGELAQLARQRAEHTRPQQIKALEPFWADLSYDYRQNQQFVDQRIAAVAQLGDSIVPLLLEKLQPSQASATARNLAANCRRVLERFDPASFVDALGELANGENEIARGEAIRLLGLARVPQAARILTDLLGRTAGEDQLLVVRSLRLLRVASAAPKIVPMLGAQDRHVREEVLAYLIAAGAASVADTVVDALGTETDPRLLPHYIDYFASCVRANERATAALLPLLERDKLDYQDTRSLVRALAEVAPPGHEATCRRLHELVDANDTSSLAVQAAVTLYRLGDKQGVARLKRTLDEQIRRRRKEAALYEQRASLLFAIEEYTDAIKDYESIIDNTEGLAMTRRAYEGLILCEARRRKTTNLIKLLKASGMTVAEIEAFAQTDAALRQALGHDRVRTFMQSLAKEQAPR